nr:2-C-methyl-D-erythritol 4-phosphate cytidylyltransferase [Thermoleophilaceae bacterium]
MAAGELVGIIAAAGTGERLGMGTPKALVACAGRQLVEWSVAPLAEACDRVIVALPAAAGEVCGALSAVEIVEGGRSRSESVAAAVRAAPDAEAYLVHD